MATDIKEITLEDVRDLRKQFEKYTETAEQHEFPTLITLDLRMKATLEEYEKAGKVTDQEDARAMFYVVLQVIGGDYKKYAKDF